MLEVFERHNRLPDPIRVLDLAFKLFVALAFILLVSGLVRYEFVAIVLGVLAAGVAIGCFAVAHHLRVHGD